MAVIGNTGSSALVTVIDAAIGSVVMEYHARAPSVSPRSEFIAFERYQPPNDPALSAQYRVLTIDRAQQTVAHASLVVYPSTSGRHRRRSELQRMPTDAGLTARLMFPSAEPALKVRRADVKIW